MGEGRVVRVWFGSRLMTEHHVDRTEAAGFAAAMRHRFAGLRVTDDPAQPSHVLVA